MLSNHTIEKKGVHVSKITLERFSDFEASYIKVRDKEKRILTIEEIKLLPHVNANYIHYNEWGIRKKNIVRFLSYLSQKNKPLRILDIGCGNGFFTNMMATKQHQVVGVDVNLTELKQATEAFPNQNISWYYLDLLNELLPEEKFDIITFCASFQYFKEPKKIIDVCFSLLNANGEIHIIDSPFYTAQSKHTAQENSKAYFKKMEVAEMSNYYCHNTFDIFKGYSMELKYDPNALINRFNRNILKITDSPFAWIILK